MEIQAGEVLSGKDEIGAPQAKKTHLDGMSYLPGRGLRTIIEPTVM